MSDTPETDFAYEIAIISAATGDFLPIATAMLKQAKKLEHERDEAREALRTLAEHGESEIQRLTKERDEAREQAARWLARLQEEGLEEYGN